MEDQERNRRRFVVSAIRAVWSVMAAGLGVIAGSYLLFPPKSRSEAGWIDVASIDDLPLGVPERVVFRRNRTDGWKVISEQTMAWVVKNPDGSPVAFQPQCTHLGCAYHWDHTSREFLCPCHMSTFSVEGEVLSGPAPRPLDRYALTVENGRLLLNPGKTAGSASAGEVS